MSKLHQVTAVLKGVKAKAYSDVSALHKDAQKADPYTGHTKTYRKIHEDGEELPADSKKVVLQASQVLAKLAKIQTDLFDLTAQQEWANQHAVSDVVVNGVTLLSAVPVTYLMFLEKQLTDVYTFVDKMPTLDENKDWTVDPNTNLFRTEKSSTQRTKKVQRAIVLYDAVIKDGTALPAQTQMITEDVIAGFWDTIHLSGALTIPRKEEILGRISALQRAVKVARENANATDVSEHSVGGPVFAYLFGT